MPIYAVNTDVIFCARTSPVGLLQAVEVTRTIPEAPCDTHLQNQKKTSSECSAWVVYVDPEYIPCSSLFHQLHINENNSIYTTASDLFTPPGGVHPSWC